MQDWQGVKKTAPKKQDYIPKKMYKFSGCEEQKPSNLVCSLPALIW